MSCSIVVLDERTAAGLVAQPDKVVDCGGNALAVLDLAPVGASRYPALAVVVRMPDGRRALARTTVGLFLAAAERLRLRHGEPVPSPPWTGSELATPVLQRLAARGRLSPRLRALLDVPL